MDETMQHIVEKEQEQVEGHQVGVVKEAEPGDNVMHEFSKSDGPQECLKAELRSQQSENDDAISNDAMREDTKLLNNEKSCEETVPIKVNGTSQNGGTIHCAENCQADTILDELEDIDEDLCEDAQDGNCKVDGKIDILVILIKQNTLLLVFYFMVFSFIS